MSAAAPPPPPSPPPESNSSEPKPGKKIRSKLPLRHRLSRTQSPKVATPALEPTRKSFIWPWLEGKLEKKPSSSPGEGSSSSPRVSDSVNVLAPTPISAVAPQNQSNTMGMLADAASTELIAVYDHYSNLWYYLTLQAYTDMLIQSEKEKLPEEDKKVEENAKEENDTVEEKEVQVVGLPKQTTSKPKTIQIGEIEVPLPLTDSEEANVNPTGSASSSSNVQDEAAKEEDEEHGQHSGAAGQKKGKKKKKKNKGKKK